MKIEGKLSADGFKFAIITARFNEIVTERLAEGAKSCLTRHGASAEAIVEYMVPGAFEIPVLAANLLESSENFDAVIAIGAVIRGETPHFDQVVSGVTSGMQSVAIQTKKPVINGVLTTDTVEQALNRAGLKAGNKGWEAAHTAIEMVQLIRGIK